jgi:hypothetical protein
MNDLTVRTMERTELSHALDWAAREGWNPGLDDEKAFWAADPDGFLLAELKGEVIGTVSAVAYGANFGFIGFFIVKPEYRGHHCGIELGRRSVDHLGMRIIGIDGVLEKQRQYQKLFGFEPMYRNVRFGGLFDAGTEPPGLTSLDELPFEHVAAYDRRFFPEPRETFLRAWLGMGNAKGLAVVSGNDIGGYGVIRKCREGWKIGPLFADSPEIAEEIFRGLCAEAAGEMVYLDVPNVNTAGVAMAKQHGMAEVFATTRMYKNGCPDLPLDGIFGVTSFELG